MVVVQRLVLRGVQRRIAIVIDVPAGRRSQIAQKQLRFVGIDTVRPFLERDVELPELFYAPVRLAGVQLVGREILNFDVDPDLAPLRLDPTQAST